MQTNPLGFEVDSAKQFVVFEIFDVDGTSVSPGLICQNMRLEKTLLQVTQNLTCPLMYM